MSRESSRRERAARCATLAALLLAAAAAGLPGPSPARDPIAVELDRWSAYADGNKSKDEMWVQVAEGARTALADAKAALGNGRRFFALQRLASARMTLAAFAYLSKRPADAQDMTALETEWKRTGPSLGLGSGAAPPAGFDTVRPAAVRAIAEAASLRVRNFYDASLEYGRCTGPAEGFFYLGVVQAQRELGTLCRAISAPPDRTAPRLRPLGGELDLLERDLLAAYRPPASIDRHPEFIAASAKLKEARELDGAGLRFRALLAYLQTAQRVAAIRAGVAPADRVALPDKLRTLTLRREATGRWLIASDMDNPNERRR